MAYHEAKPNLATSGELQRGVPGCLGDSGYLSKALDICLVSSCLYCNMLSLKDQGLVTLVRHPERVGFPSKRGDS
jgi:hypothetical protein